MDIFNVTEIIGGRNLAEHTYAEFFRAATDSCSVGLAVWPAGALDDQKPHAEDEIYYVVSGRGRIRVAGESREVVPGSVVFVGAHVVHQFHDISERLDVLVFWSPARGAVR